MLKNGMGGCLNWKWCATSASNENFHCCEAAIVLKFSCWCWCWCWYRLCYSCDVTIVQVRLPKLFTHSVNRKSFFLILHHIWDLFIDSLVTWLNLVSSLNFLSFGKSKKTSNFRTFGAHYSKYDSGCYVWSFKRAMPCLYSFILSFLCNGQTGLKVERAQRKQTCFSTSTPAPGLILGFPKNFSLDVAEIYWLHCLEQWTVASLYYKKQDRYNFANWEIWTMDLWC